MAKADLDTRALMLFLNHRKVLEALTDADRGKLVLALMDYLDSGTLPNFEGRLDMAFFILQDDVDRSVKRWEAVIQQRSEAGKKSAAARAAKKIADEVSCECDPDQEEAALISAGPSSAANEKTSDAARQAFPANGKASAADGRRYVVDGEACSENGEAFPVAEHIFPSAEQALSAAEQPLPDAERPLIVAEQPLTAVKRPLTVLDQPLSAVKRPLSAVERPLTAVERPLTAVERPLTAVNETERPEANAAYTYTNTSTNTNSNSNTNSILSPRKPPGGRDAGFEQFWSLYPRKVGKKAAKRAFDRADIPLDRMLEALKRQLSDPQWQREKGRYIPNPSTWLNQGRWADEGWTPPGRSSGQGFGVETL